MRIVRLGILSLGVAAMECTITLGMQFCKLSNLLRTMLPPDMLAEFDICCACMVMIGINLFIDILILILLAVYNVVKSKESN